jgi:hypothetical protein
MFHAVPFVAVLNKFAFELHFVLHLKLTYEIPFLYNFIYNSRFSCLIAMTHT